MPRILDRIKKPAAAIMVASVAPFALTGCFTADVNHNQLADSYYKMPQTYTPFKVEGAQEITFRAAEGKTVSMEIANTLPPRGQYAVPKTAFEECAPALVNGLATVGGIAVGGAVMNNILGTLTEKTVVPTQIVRPEVVRPDVVRPEVVEPTIVEVEVPVPME